MIKQRVEEMTFGTSVTNLASPNFVRFFRDGPNLTTPTANPVCAAGTIAVGCVAIVMAESDWTGDHADHRPDHRPDHLQGRSQVPVEFVCPNASIPAYASSAGCPRQP